MRQAWNDCEQFVESTVDREGIERNTSKLRLVLVGIAGDIKRIAVQYPARGDRPGLTELTSIPALADA